MGIVKSCLRKGNKPGIAPSKEPGYGCTTVNFLSFSVCSSMDINESQSQNPAPSTGNKPPPVPSKEPRYSYTTLDFCLSHFAVGWVAARAQALQVKDQGVDTQPSLFDPPQFAVVRVPARGRT